MKARFTVVADRELPEHLLTDTHDALQSVGWVGIVRQNITAPPLHAVHFRGVRPLLNYSHEGFDHDGVLRSLATGWHSLGVAAAAVTSSLAAQPPALVVLDVDSTLIQAEVIERIAARAGAEEQVAQLTSRAMHGKSDFATSLRARLELVAGVPVAELAVIADEIEFSPGAARLVDAVHAAGGAVGVVSGGFHEVVDILAARLGIDHVRANRLAVDGNKLAGAPAGPIIDRTAKKSALLEWSALHPGPTVAIGDGANDLLMVQAANLGVAYCAKPVLAQQAGAVIPFPRLDAAALLAGLAL